MTYSYPPHRAPTAPPRPVLLPVAAISQLVVGLLLTAGAALFWLSVANAPQRLVSERGQPVRLTPGHADRRVAKMVAVTLMAAAAAQVVLAIGVWLGSRPATIASVAVAGLLVVWQIFGGLSFFVFTDERVTKFVFIAAFVFGLIVYAALCVTLVEAVKRCRPSPPTVPAGGGSAAAASASTSIPSGSGARGRAGWTQVGLGVLLLVIAAIAAVWTHVAVSGPRQPDTGRADVAGIAMFGDELKLARTTALYLIAAAVAQLAMAPAVGGGSRPLTLASLLLAGLLAAVHALVLVGALWRGGGMAAAVSAVLLATELLLCVLLAIAARARP